MNTAPVTSTSHFMAEAAAAFHAGYPGVIVASREFDRLDGLLARLGEALGLNLLAWNPAFGEVDPATKSPRSEAGGRLPELVAFTRELMERPISARLIVVHDAFLALENEPRAAAALGPMLQRIAAADRRSFVVLATPEAELPKRAHLPDLPVITLRMPSESEIEDFLDEVWLGKPEALETSLRDRLVKGCAGLGEQHARALLNDARVRLCTVDVHVVLRQLHTQKARLLAQNGALELVDVDDIAEVGGLKRLSDWLMQRSRVFGDLQRARDAGVRVPKGVMLVGIPGCGKSLSAKFTARQFGLPLVRLDIGRLLGRYVGDSEANTRAALSTVESMSPCVLWIDEIEKTFAGLANGQASEVTARLVGTLLTWLQDHRKPVFVVATANDITKLPTELLRKGRFDEIFYVDIPTPAERLKILEVHLRRDWGALTPEDRNALVALSRGFTGADIESALNEARILALNEDAPLGFAHLRQGLRATIPLTRTMASAIKASRERYLELHLPSASDEEELTPVRLRQLSDAFSDKEKLLAATYPDAPDEILESLAHADNRAVREAVLTHPHCPSTVIKSCLAAGPAKEPELFKRACKHSNAPAEYLAQRITESAVDEKLALEMLEDRNNRLDAVVVAALFRQFNTSNIQVAIASHPNCPADALEQLFSSSMARVRLAAAGNPSLDNRHRQALLHSSIVEELAAIAVNPACSDEERERARRVARELATVQKGNEMELCRLAETHDLDERVIWLLGRNPLPQVAARLAVHPMLPGELQRDFVKRPALAIALAQNPRLLPDVQERLVAPGESSDFTLETLARSFASDQAQQRRGAVARQLASNPGLDLSLAGLLLDAGGDGAAVLLAGRHDIGPMHARKIMERTGVSEVLFALGTNPYVGRKLDEDFAYLAARRCSPAHKLKLLHAGRLDPAIAKILNKGITHADLEAVEALLASAGQGDGAAEASSGLAMTLSELTALVSLARASIRQRPAEPCPRGPRATHP